MALRTQRIEYTHGDNTFEAHMAWDNSWSEPRPGVLVSHAWRGRSDFENEKAEKLARLGYVGFALDLYGKGIFGNSPDENQALMQPLLDDRATLQQRMHLSLSEIRSRTEVDSQNVAAIGFCFGWEAV